MKLIDLLTPWTNTALPDCTITSLHNDSRKINPGALFFAYPGVVADGRLFMQQAKAAGASVIVYEPEHWPKTVACPDDVPCIAVPQLSSKLAAIASRFYDEPSRKLSVLGVTGTNGKTTIAYQLAEAYSQQQKAVYIGTLGYGPVKHLNALMNTTPDALCLQHLLYDYQQQGVSQVCMEVSSHGLSQGRVEHIDFIGAIYTNLSLDHLDYHQTMQAYAEAKARLFATPSLQWAVINKDDAHSALMIEKLPISCQRLTYGLHEACDVQALHWKSTMHGSQFEVKSPWGQHHIEVKLIGAFNIYNSLAVFASLAANGMPINEVIHIMKQLNASPGRMEVVSQRPCVIVDYAHTPDALENVLATLLKLKQGRLGVVFGCGGDRDKTKRPIMGRIASQYADFVVLTSDNPRSEDPARIIDEVAAGLLPISQVVKVANRKEAIHHALSMTDTCDILLIAGKGHEDYQQIGKERFEFSDQAVVREYMTSQKIQSN